MKERRRARWITTTDASEMLDSDSAKLDRLIDEGHVTTTRISGITYVNVRDLHPFTGPGASA